MLGAFQDDELLEYAEQQAREEEEEDEDDPLDAFMANIEVLQAFKGGGNRFYFFGFVSDDKESRLQWTFFRMDKNCSQPKLSRFEISKIYEFTLCTKT